jgi:hypothetical protein
MLTTLAYEVFGNPTCNLILLTRSLRVLFMRSAMPFSCGVPGIVFSILIPFAAQNCLNPPSLYSPPFSDLRHFSFKLVYVSTMAFHFLKVSNELDYFSRNRPIPFCLNDQWKWCNIASLQGMQHEGAHKSMCTKSNFPGFCVLPIVTKLTFLCFLRMQPSHKSYSTYFSYGSFPSDRSTFFPFSLIWLSLICHRFESGLAFVTVTVSLMFVVIARVSVFYPWWK